jgi:MFS family permease
MLSTWLPDLSMLASNPAFRTYWGGRTVSAVGDTFMMLAFPIVLFDITGSPRSVGAALILFTLPRLLLSVAGGLIVDRLGPLRVMIGVEVARGLLLIGLAVALAPGEVWALYAVAFLMGVAGALALPAAFALVPRLVQGRDQLMAANGLLQSGGMIAMLVGPVLAGVVVGAWDVRIAFLINAVSFLVLAAALLWIRRAVATDTSLRRPVTVRAKVSELLALLRGSRLLQSLLLLMSLLIFSLALKQALLVPLLRGDLGASPGDVGLTASGAAVGGLVGGAYATKLRASVAIGVALAGLTVLLAAATAAIGVAPTLAIAAAAFAMATTITTLVQAGLQGLLQGAVEDTHRGRVAGVLSTLLSGARLVGIALGAELATMVGSRMTFLFSAALLLAVAPVALTLRKLNVDGEAARRVGPKSLPTAPK